MTKLDIIRAAAKAAGVTQNTAAAVLKGAFEAAVDALATGDTVNINGCGTFKIKQRKAHTVYNFSKRETMKSADCNIVSFAAAEAIKQRINAEEGERAVCGSQPY